MAVTLPRYDATPPASPAADLGAVASTLLIPLAARSHADAMFPAMAVGDAHAARLLAALRADVSAFLADRHSMFGVLSRTRTMRAAAQRLFARHPQATGAALGAGLSHYHQWLDNGRNRWIDIDQPEVIALRERLLPPTADRRRTNVVADLTEDGWWQRAGLPEGPAAAPVLLLAEGVLMYLAPAQVQRLLHAFGRHAPPGSRLLADCFCRQMTGMDRLHPSVRLTPARFLWGLRDLAELSRPHPRLRLLAEHPVMDAMGLPYALAGQMLRFVTGVPFYGVFEIGVA